MMLSNNSTKDLQDSGSTIISVHYGEISLKGKNFRDFENALIKNIRKRQIFRNSSITKMQRRIIIKPSIHLKGNAKNRWISEGIDALSKTFGISWYGIGREADRNIESIVNAMIEGYNTYRGDEKEKGKIYGVEVKRIDKTYPKTSLDIRNEIIESIHRRGYTVKKGKGIERVYVEWFKDRVFVIVKRFRGLGGLPYKTSGKLICLVSGGIDSPLATWLCMKRGANIVLLHVYVGSLQNVKKSKIPKIRDKLQEYACENIPLFVVNASSIYKAMREKEKRYRTIIFRRFIILLAKRIADKMDAKGIVLGDSIGQVASQTLENMYAVQHGIDIPIIRPLITYDKQEIVDLSKKVGLYEISIQRYLDPCACRIKAITKAKREMLKEIEEKIKLNEIVDKAEIKEI